MRPRRVDNLRMEAAFEAYWRGGENMDPPTVFYKGGMMEAFGYGYIAGMRRALELAADILSPATMARVRAAVMHEEEGLWP